ncbi:ribosome recycling factor [Geothermobacter hydrogeniphilus]|uniref:Ribosome-recycling factor n=1 Tax=Geothermobacter hydrogeniphilus TaxID=1969733 RepID=A0A2K2H8Y6_9BACT|nr:ribosome recycling factor [Geothermobacter hydrogeniphilus]PNU19782.1 ribosome recycling factor [Geothermobacter hydrogeniphilus]
MLDEVKKKAGTAMDKAIEALKRDLGKVRTGRASLSLLEDVRVDYYGTPTPLNQVGTLAVPEPRLITIQPWEKQLIPEIEKAIFKADLGLNPSSDGQLVRIAIPALTEERRKEMVKVIKRMGEDCKIAIRGARRDANDALKNLLKEKDITEDEQKRTEKDVQDLTDRYVKKVDDVLDVKEQEVMEI